MIRSIAKTLVLASLGTVPSHAASYTHADEFSWLEGPREQRVAAWVEAQNRRTFAMLKSDRRYPGYFQEALEALLNAGSARSFYETTIFGDWVYQLQVSSDRPRGAWRRATVESYLGGKPKWDLVLDVDALAHAEGRAYHLVSAGSQCQLEGERCMLPFVEAGSPVYDFWREFDLRTGRFVSDGFVLPSGRHPTVMWDGNDALLVATDFGPGSVDRDGNPLVIKRWKRGQLLAEAREVFRAAPDARLNTDLHAFDFPTAKTDRASRAVRLIVVDRGRGTQREYWRDLGGDRFVRLKLFDGKGIFGIHRGQVIFTIARDWTIAGRRWPGGSILSVDLALADDSAPRIHSLLTPDPRRSSVLIALTRGGILARFAEDVRGQLWGFTFNGYEWKSKRLPLPENGTVASFLVANPNEDVAFARYESLLKPGTVYAARVDTGQARAVSTDPAAFDASHYVSEQLHAISRDGTRVPYFIARPASLRYDGRAPTILSGYGASGVPYFPNYDATLNRLWLAKGGVFVIANIRGGGEFGRSWMAFRAERRVVYEDFIAVARDLIRRKITSPARLGITGMSAGGLLVGVMITQRPELFRAAVARVPDLDPFRLDLVAGGASAYAPEFGMPDDPKDRAFLEETSPFRNLRPMENFPEPFLITSSTDDNVSPALARRFAAKADKLKLPFLFLETAEGGHAAASTPQQFAELDALIYTYFARRLMD